MTSGSNIKYVQNLISEARLEEALEAVLSFDNLDKNAEMQIRLLQARIAEIKQDAKSGIIRDTEVITENNMIASSLLLLLTTIDGDNVRKSNEKENDKGKPRGIWDRVKSFITGDENKEKKFWEDTLKENTEKAYIEYTKEYPNGEYTKQAKEKLGELHEEEEWNKAFTKNTIPNYHRYLHNFPDGKYAKDAYEYLEKLADEQLETNSSNQTEQEKTEFLVQFQDKPIRVVNENEEKWFVLEDIIELLTDTINPKSYLNMLLRKEETLKSITKYFRIKSEVDGKYKRLRCVNTEGALRFIMSIPSPKAEPFKLWLAQQGKEHLDETETKQFNDGSNEQTGSLKVNIFIIEDEKEIAERLKKTILSK
jgi:prophage antirepressor-like protein